MVRRWSYINSINCSSLTTTRRIHKASIDVNLNALMYLKKRYSYATKITRKQWARRKHVNNWIAASNILKNWASAYKFYKNTAKITYNQFFTANTFIAFNVVASLNSTPAILKGSEDVFTSSYTRRVLNYYKIYSNPRLKFLQLYKNTRPLNVSFYWTFTKRPQEQLDTVPNVNNSVVTVLRDNLDFVLPVGSSPSVISQNSTNTWLLNIFNFTHHLYNYNLVFIYKTLILITLTRLHYSKN